MPDYRAQNNLFFISGPHGAGKTTLVDRLLTAEPRLLMPDLITATSKFDIEPTERQRLKVSQRALENYELSLTARGDSTHMYLGNRCVYDSVAYCAAYSRLGWIENAEFKHQMSHIEYVFPTSLQRPNVIILNPPFEVVKSRLENRWKTNSKKWQEENMDYLREACSSYEKFKDYQNVLYIRESEPTPIIEWMLKKQDWEK